jgi:hypothetical protein
MSGVGLVVIVGAMLVIASFFMLRFAHVLMSLVGVAAVFCVIAGVGRLEHSCSVDVHDVGSQIAGAILVGVGVLTVLAIAITLKVLRPDMKKRSETRRDEE